MDIGGDLLSQMESKRYRTGVQQMNALAVGSETGDGVDALAPVAVNSEGNVSAANSPPRKFCTVRGKRIQSAKNREIDG